MFSIFTINFIYVVNFNFQFFIFKATHKKNYLPAVTVAGKRGSVTQNRSSSNSPAVTRKSASGTQNRPSLNRKLDKSEIDPAALLPKCQLAFVKVKRLSEMELTNRRILPK